MNKARTRGARDKRSVPLHSLESDDFGAAEPSVDPKRSFTGFAYPGHWSTAPQPWGNPEKDLLTGEMMAVVQKEVERLPRAQQLVITLRDIHGLDAFEVCNTLGVSETNQRVLLHRARAKVRSAVENHFELRRGAACGMTN